MKSKRQCITSVKSREIAPDELVTIVLLCDSPGYRMKSYGAIPLIPFKTKRLIDIQINNITKIFKNVEIILCVGYDSEKVCKYVKNKYRNINIRIVENQMFNKCNSSEGVRLCLNNINNDKIIIIDGSLLIHSQTFKSLDRKKSGIFIEAFKNEDLEIGVNIGDKNTIEYFGFGASQIWSEIIFLNSHDIIEALRKLLSAQEHKTRFFFEILNDLIRTKYNLEAISNKHPVQKMSNIKTYHKLRGTL